MRKLLFGSESKKCNEVFEMMHESSVVCLELFTSCLRASTGTELGVPYFWGVQNTGTMIYGRDIHSFYKCLERLVESEVKIVYSFSLNELFYFLKYKFSVSSIFRSSKQEILHFSLFVGRGQLEFKSISSLAGAGTIELFANITPQWNRRALTPASRLRYDDIALFYRILVSEEKFISRLSEEYNGVANIPTSLSAIVKKGIEDSCGVRDAQRRKLYLRKIGSLYNENTMEIPSVANLMYLNHMFQGGYIGYNDEFVGKTLDNVVCYDFTSSYPARMAAYKYPVSCVSRVDLRGKNCDIDKLISKSEYLYTFRVKLSGVRSVSCCRPLKFDVRGNGCLDGGMKSICSYSNDIKRDSSSGIISASELVIDICSVDWEYIREFYKFDSVELEFMEVYLADYLPEEYIIPMINLFVNKSVNKGNPDKFVEDMSKKQVNITWGIMGAGFYRSNYSVDNGYESNDMSHTLYQYNKFQGPFRNRTSCYQWAVFCTAYARRDLLGVVKLLGNDWLYSDSDAAYFFSRPEHLEMIKKYNEWIEKELLKNPYIRGVDDICVKSSFVDKEYHLGAMTLDGVYKRFKYLKLKTYLCESVDGSFKLRMSGCSNFNYDFFKTVADPFEWFTGGSHIPADFCDFYGRYTDFENYDGTVYDYLGIPCDISLRSGCVRFPKDFTISDSSVMSTDEFIEMLLGG